MLCYSQNARANYA